MDKRPDDPVSELDSSRHLDDPRSTASGHAYSARLMSPVDWLIQIDVSDAEASFADAIATLGNGYLGLRPSPCIDDAGVDRCFLAADLYDRGIGAAREIVNLPSPLGAQFRSRGLAMRRISPWHRVLDMRRALFFTWSDWETASGACVCVSSVTMLSATQPSLGLRILSFRQLAPGAPLEIDVYWDFSQGNCYLGGVVPFLQANHVVMDHAEYSDCVVELACHTTGDAEAVRLLGSYRSDPRVVCHPMNARSRHGVTLLQATPCRSLDVTILWSVSKDESEMDHELKALDEWQLLTQHCHEWERRWENLDFSISADTHVTEGMRFAMFHLLQFETSSADGSISPARGLSSTYHQGSTFFDTELHKDAVWAWIRPEVARSHLIFRHQTLPAARGWASETGYSGARFPEASNDRGNDNGPRRVYEYPTGRFLREWSGDEVVHVSADVAYAVARYFAVTGDTEFMSEFGIDLIVDTARFAASVLQPTGVNYQSFGTLSIMGPDEYHYHVNNNLFTNAMLKWNLEYATELLTGGLGEIPLDLVQSVQKRLAVSADELAEWSHVARNVHFPADVIDGVPSQFEGYADLPDCPPRPLNRSPAARLTAAEELAASRLENFRTKVIKQADVVLLMQLLPESLVGFHTEATYRYYESRTAHESSLSAAPHGVVAARIGLMDEAEQFLLRSCRYNLDFRPRDSYSNGVHLSAYAGAWQVLLEGMVGLRPMGKDILGLTPQIPSGWNQYRISLQYQSRQLSISVEPHVARVALESGPPLRLRGPLQTVNISEGNVSNLSLDGPPPK